MKIDRVYVLHVDYSKVHTYISLEASTGWWKGICDAMAEM